VTTVELLERGPFLDGLRAHLAEAERGAGRLVLLAGEAGIERTSVVETFCRDQAARARILRGSCDAFSTPSPLGALQDMAPSLGGDIEQLIEIRRQPAHGLHGCAEPALDPRSAQLGRLRRRLPPMISG